MLTAITIALLQHTLLMVTSKAIHSLLEMTSLLLWYHTAWRHNSNDVTHCKSLMWTDRQTNTQIKQLL